MTYRPTRRTWQKGFTMIELIVVIVILGILAAVALPKFIDLTGDARTAALNGMVGAAGAAMSLNYAGCAATGNAATLNKCVTVNNCSDAVGLIQGGLPAEYAVTAAAISTTNGATASCTMTQTFGSHVASATFMGIAAGN